MTIIIKQTFQELNSFLINYEKSPLKEPDNLHYGILTYLKKIDCHFQRNAAITLGELAKKSAIKALTSVEKSIENQIFEKIDEVKERVLKIKERIYEKQEKIAVNQKFLISKPEILLKLAIFCDIDCPDHNGAFVIKFHEALEKRRPIITSRSILCCVDVEKGPWDKNEGVIKIKIAMGISYDIFSGEDGLILLLPKTLLPNLSLKEKLITLDFAANRLQLITKTEAFQLAPRKNSVDDLINMFNPLPNIDKAFFLGGHGNDTCVGALKKNNYLKFLDLVEEQRGKGLVISSCSSGGKSSTINFPLYGKPRTFSIIVHSIGDFETHCPSSLLASIDAFALFLEDQPPTYSKLNHVIEKLGDNKKKIHNCIKVYFAHSALIDGGFRPLGEHGINYPVTFNKVQAAKMMHTPLSIPNTQYAAINPSVIHSPLIFTEGNPVLLSMIPGQGSHFIESIELNSEKEFPSDYVKRCLKANIEIKVKKGFFLKNISTPTSKIEDVALLFDKWGGYAVFKENESYYFINGAQESKTQVTPYIHALFVKQMLESTKTDENALNSLSCGQESDSTFTKAFQKSKIISSDIPERLLTNKEPDADQILSENLSPLDLSETLFFLLQNGYADTAMKLWNQKKFSAKTQGLRGNPLLITATYFGSIELLEGLLNQSGNNGKELSEMRSPSLECLLIYALSSTEEKLAKLIKIGVTLPTTLSLKDKEHLQKYISLQIQNRNLQSIEQLIGLALDKQKEFLYRILADKLLKFNEEGIILLKEYLQINPLSIGDLFLLFKEKQREDSTSLLEHFISTCVERLKWHLEKWIATSNYATPLIIESFCERIEMSQRIINPITNIIVDALLSVDEEKGSQLLKNTFFPGTLPIRDILFQLKNQEPTPKVLTYKALCEELLSKEKASDFYI